MNEAERYFRDKLEHEIDSRTLSKIIKAKNPNYIIVDVRDKEEYEREHIPTAIHIPRHELEKHLSKLSKEKKVVVYCHDSGCLASTKAALALAEKGHNTMELLGGFEEWKKHNKD